MAHTEDLQARYTHVKSHYGKAKVTVIDDKNSYLISYTTKVAEVINGKLIIYGTYSNTTMRHLTDYINQYSKEYVSNNNDIRSLIK